MKGNLKVALLFLGLSLTSFLYSQTAISKAQAMFIYNFTRHINWPDTHKSGDFVVGFVGNTTALADFTAFATNKKVGSQAIKVETYASVDQIGKCHVLFVAFSKTTEMADILAKLGAEPTLIIGEKKGATDIGVGINFVTVSNRLKFELKTSNIASRGLSVSGSLANMAIMID